MTDSVLTEGGSESAGGGEKETEGDREDEGRGDAHVNTYK